MVHMESTWPLHILSSLCFALTLAKPLRPLHRSKPLLFTHPSRQVLAVRPKSPQSHARTKLFPGFLSNQGMVLPYRSLVSRTQVDSQVEGLARRFLRRETMISLAGVGLMTFVPNPALGKVTYGVDITEPELDRDFGPEETVQAELAWEQFRTKTKNGLQTPPPTQTRLSPSRYLAIIYAFKQDSFDTLKDFFRRAVEKETMTGMSNEFRRMDTYLIQDAFNDMRQSMYYLPLAVAQTNSALGFNLQRRYNVVEVDLEALDQNLNFLSYGRSDVTNEDLGELKQRIKDLESSTNTFIEYATRVVSML
ncbi:hypothetical protein AAMO2058_001032700 [Amorphochlora amoebiformis]